jgi:hypothetical protein
MSTIGCFSDSELKIEFLKSLFNSTFYIFLINTIGLFVNLNYIYIQSVFLLISDITQ